MVLDTFPQSVFWKDRQSVYLGCNQNFANNANLSTPSQIIGKIDYDLPWGRTEADFYRADDAQVINSGVAKLSIIETQVQADGSMLWLETNKIPLRNFNNEVIGVLGTYQDISDRKQAEQTIRQQIEKETVLRQITQKMRETLDLQRIFETACQEIRQFIQSDRVGIFRFYPDSGFDDGEFVAESVQDGLSSVLAIPIHDHCFGEDYAQRYTEGRVSARKMLT